MLLDDPVGYRQAKAGALSRRFGGEEGVVDAMQMFG
jgi:hypothetical protein